MITVTWQALLAQYGVTAITAVAAAYAAFRFFGKKWLELQFSQRLEAFKHAKNREIEELRGEINALLDRTVKLHAKEFEVLPLAWDKLFKAYGAARQVASRGQSYPEVTWMENDRLNALTDKLGLESIERNEIGVMPKGRERQEALNAILDRHRMADAFQRQDEARAYLVANGIFIQPELKTKLRELLDLVWDALNERQFDRQFPEPGARDRWTKADALAEHGQHLYDEIEASVQARLWDRRLLVAPGQ